MAKSGNNENKIEKLVRVGFYELEKTIGKRGEVALWYLNNPKLKKSISLSMKQTQTHRCCLN